MNSWEQRATDLGWGPYAIRRIIDACSSLGADVVFVHADVIVLRNDVGTEFRQMRDETAAAIARGNHAVNDWNGQSSQSCSA